MLPAGLTARVKGTVPVAKGWLATEVSPPPDWIAKALMPPPPLAT